MTIDHPITPPPELAEQWLNLWTGLPTPCPPCNEWLATQAARWGADMELEACANWLADPCAADMPSLAKDLRYSRRPKPPSLAERALDAQRRMWDGGSSHADWGLIRAALERLQELESNG